jgi:hypothetical protein
MNISRLEPDLRLRASLSQTVCVGANTISDALVVLPFSANLMDRISLAMCVTTKLGTLYPNTFWSKGTSGKNSLIVFACEYKGDYGACNKNQLVMDFATAQSQRRALGLDPGIIWGATYAEGSFEVYSSEWVENVRFSLLSKHQVAHRFSGYHIYIASPVEFARPHRFHEVLFVPSQSRRYHGYLETTVRRHERGNYSPICCLLPLACVTGGMSQSKIGN